MSGYIIAYFILLALGISTGAFRYYVISPGSRYFFALLVITALVETIAWYAGTVYHSNVIVYRLLIPIQYTLIALGCSRELRKFAKTAIVSSVLITVICVADFVLTFDFIDKHYPTSVKTVCNLLIIGWTLLYLSTLLRVDTLASFTSFPLFWLSLGWLLFSVVNLTYFGTVNYLGLHGQSFLRVFDNIRMVSNFVLYTLFIVAFLSKQQTLQKAT